MGAYNAISLAVAVLVLSSNVLGISHIGIKQDSNIKDLTSTMGVVREATGSNGEFCSSTGSDALKSTESNASNRESSTYDYSTYLFVRNKDGTFTYKTGDTIRIMLGIQSPWDTTDGIIKVNDLVVAQEEVIHGGFFECEYVIPPSLEGKKVVISGSVYIYNGDEGYGWEDLSYETIEIYTSPPIVSKNPSNLALKTGQKADFSAGFNGNFLSYQWYKDGNAIAGATKDNYSVTANSNSSGSYTCKAVNTGGAATTNAAVLTVQATATFLGNGGTNGSSITKPCGSSLGTLPDSMREGYLLNGWYTQPNGGTLINVNTKMPENDVVYYAQWKDSKKPEIINAAYVITNDAAGYWVYVEVIDREDGVYFVSCPTWTVKDGQDDMESNWSEYPNPVAAEEVGGGFYRFYVDRSDHNNEYGTYITQCYAFDYEKNCSDMAQFSVRFDNPPVIRRQPANLRGEIGQKVLISVDCVGDNLRYQWYVSKYDQSFGGTLIESATKETYEKTITLEDNNNYYYCVVTNSSGTVTTEAAKISVEYPMMKVSIPMSVFLLINPNGEDSLPSISIKNNSLLPVKVALKEISGDTMAVVSKDTKVWKNLGLRESKKFISFGMGDHWYSGYGKEVGKELAILQEGEVIKKPVNVFHGYSFDISKLEKFQFVFKIDYQL